MIGLDRIKSLILQGIGARILLARPIPRPLLVQIQKHPRPGLTHGIQRRMQLRSTVAFQAAQHIAGETGRMQPRQNRLIAGRAPISTA